ncbi:MAG: Resolvase domain protein [Clostridia bacterium 62_21]|nr:MAG: Resolvase domain protein [Clostridia bacterium 62_21]HAG07599.1 serine recombinase [Peptococcaceae bacterium]
MLAVIYVRVSTEDQARHGYSLEAQEDACRKKARELGADKVQVYRDEGVTGAILERPGLQAALSAAKGADWFILYDPDRLSRKLAHQLLLAETIEKAGCRLEFVTCEWEDTPEGRLFYSLRGAIAEYEKEKFKARSKFGKQAKARRGLLTHDPRTYGYRYCEGTYRVEEAEALVYRRMVDMALSGMSPEAIARQLQAEGVPAPRGKKWYRATVRRILKNPAYAGTLYLNRYDAEGVKAARQRGRKAGSRIRPRESWIAVPVPPIIDRDTWEMLQERLREMKSGRRGGRVHHYPLSGLLRCGVCGAPLHGNAGRSRTGRTYRYYVCANAWQRANTDRARPVAKCPGGMHRADVLEQAVWARVRAWLEDPDALVRDVADDGAVQLAERELGRVRRLLARLEAEHERAYKAYREGLVTEEMFKRAVEDLARQRNSLTARVREIEEAQKAAAVVAQGIESLRDLARKVSGRLDDLDWDDRGKLIRMLVRGIRVGDDQIIIEAGVRQEDVGSQIGTAPCGAVPSISATFNAGMTTPSSEPLSEEQQ